MGFIDPSQLDPLPDQKPSIGGRFITEADLDPLPELTPAKTSYGGNMLRSALSGVTGGLSDEIGAYGAAGLDRLFGSATDFNKRKDEYLNLARQSDKEFAKQNPGSDFAAKVAGGVAMPLGAVGKGLSLVPRMALQGGTAGAITGFGTSEGGLGERLKGAAAGGAGGAALGGLMGLGAQGLKNLAPKLLDEASTMQRKSLGARASDYAKTTDTLKNFDIADNAEVSTLTKKSLDDLIESGVFGNTRDPVKLQKIANKESQSLANAIGKAIKENDTQVPVSFSKTKELLNEGKIPGDEVNKYLRKLTKLEDQINSSGSKLSYLQQQKIAFGTKWNPDDSIANKFNRAIYSDLQNTIESVVPEVSGLNKQLQKWQIFQNINTRNIANEEAKDASQAFINTIRTSGGFGVPILAGSYAGGPWGALGGATVAGLGKLYSTPTGRRMSAEIVEKVASSANGADKVAEKIVKPLVSQATRASSSKSDESKQLPKLQKAIRQQSASLPNKSAPKAENITIPSPNFTPETAPTPSGNKKRDVSAVVSKLHPLIQAVISTESSGNPNARSSAGARGLMQVMPEHYKRLGVTDPEDPLQSIKAGTTILQEEMDRFDDPYLALSAYNAGSPKVIKAIAKAGSSDFSRVYPYLPRETQQYVAKVLKKYQQIKV